MKQKQRKHKLNGEVRFPQVRLIGRGEPILLSSREAYLLSVNESKDLILINEDAEPPVVRIDDYNKFIYDQEKGEKERKKKQLELKEIQLSAVISDHDLMVKSRKAQEFLSEGHKVKCVLLMKGRLNSRPEQAELVMLKFISSLEEHGTPEALPKLDGKKWIATIRSKKK
jgi:translation initiation factor IF-3